MPHTETHTGVALRMMRETLGLSLRDLAAIADIDHSMLSKVERGMVNASPRWIKAVTDAMGQHLAETRNGDAA